MDVVQADSGASEVVVVAAGEVDIATEGDLLTGLRTALASAAKRPVVLDMSGVTFIDARGVAVLQGAGLQARARGASLSVRRPSREVRRVLEILKPSLSFSIEAA